MYGFSYPGRADHLQRYRITFNFPDVPIDLVRGETYILTLLLVRHVRQDQSLPCTAFQWHPAIGEDLSPPDSKLEKMIVASRLIYIYRYFTATMTNETNAFLAMLIVLIKMFIQIRIRIRVLGKRKEATST